ncbi:hypothetical protein [Yersinia kristensenii]|uniref:hypothetical protein n=1 Tax=Yersinia kristensenii TaxID=28152 RepID=UPI0011A002D8|nr:hypothetical protein [Yersinia kristensenii]
MKELDIFTVERLEELGAGAMFFTGDEVAALARIALAAKSAEPVAWVVGDATLYNSDTVEAYAKRSGLPVSPLYTTPQLNSPEIPEGWKLTPINPTAEMMAAAMECDDVVYDLDDDTIFCVQFDNIYAAMLAAAPGKANG